MNSYPLLILFLYFERTAKTLKPLIYEDFYFSFLYSYILKRFNLYIHGKMRERGCAEHDILIYECFFLFLRA